MKRFFLLSLLCLFAADPGIARAEPVPTRYGLALLGGTGYDPDAFPVGLVQGYALFDYERVFFWHEAPEDLRLRVEGNLGLAGHEGQRIIASVNMLAFTYFECFAGKAWRPYLEGGIGVVYTDFQVHGQGLRVNFNPQAGAGVEWSYLDGQTLQLGLRLHHISNGGLHEDNRGINSVLLSVGWLFQ